MKIRSVKTNYILNIIRAVTFALITIITMPYINKILGPVNVGKVEYVNTIINYFVLFSALGIPMYGIREIAKVRADKNERDKTTVELLIILLITSVVSYALLFGVLYQLDFFSNYRDLILLMSVMIVLTNVGAEWYFQGMEDQVYITIRYVLVRIVSVVILFLLVKSSEDYLMYAFTLVITVCGSNIFNIYHLLKTIDFKKVRQDKLDIKRHLKPIMTIFVAAISVNIYLQLDNFLISTISGDEYLGYYSVSNKLIRFLITFITIVGMVLLPRLSNLYETDRALYFVYLKKAFVLILLMAIPSSIVFFIFSSSIIALFAGQAFLPSVLTMQLLSPLCIIVGIAYFIGYLLLYTQNEEKIYTKAVLISAIFSVCVNFFAISHYQQNGAAVVAVLAELLAILIMIYFAKSKIRELHLLDGNLMKILAISIAVFILSLVFNYSLSIENNYFKILSIFFPYLFFFLFLIITKERVTTELITLLSQKLRKKTI